MNKFFWGLVLGIILGAAGYWYLQQKARQHPEAEQHYEDSAARARTSASDAAHNISDAFKAKIATLNLGTNEISDELKRTGKVFRRKSQDLGDRIMDAASDARVVTEIKAKYIADPDLSAWAISVSCDQGHVTLTGTVSAPEYIGKAVAEALEVDGVRDVNSALEVKPKT